MGPRQLFAISAAVLVFGVPAEALPRPVGPVVDLHPDTCRLYLPDADLDGARLLVAWDDPGGVVVRGRAALEVDLGPIEVVSAPPNHFAEPVVTAMGDGTFVIAWRRGGYQQQELVWRRFDAMGEPAGELQAVGDGDDPALILLPNGDFALAWWESRPTETEGVLDVVVLLRMWGVDGMPRNEAAVVDTVEYRDDDRRVLRYPGLAVDSDGRVFVHWEYHLSAGLYSESELRARLFASDGNPLGAAWTLVEHPGWLRRSVSAADLSEGRWLVVGSLPGGGVVGQIWEDTEFAAGPPFQISAKGDSPTVARGREVSPVVVWVEDLDEIQLAKRLLMRTISHDGVTGGPVVELASEPDGSALVYSSPRLSCDGVARFALVWQVSRSTPVIPTPCESGQAVYLLELDAGLLQDDFETGDLSAWGPVQATP